MKCLITGGCGFIGSHLADRLIDDGHTVLAIDDLTTGSIENVVQLKGNPRFRYVIDTVLNETLLAEMVEQVDLVFHLAAAVGVKLIVDEPIRTIQTNIDCTELVLKHAAKKGKPVLITSSSEVYGKSEKIPYAETHDLVYGPTTNSRWSYAFSKAIDEFLALAYHQTAGLPVRIARLFNTAGPRQTGHYGMVIPRFVQQALRGEPITVYGDGNQTRSFCHVADACRALILLMQNEDTAGQIYNVGSTEEITMLALAKKVCDKTATGSPIQFLSYDQAYARGFEDMHRRVPDITKIQQAVGFVPKLTLDQILDDVIAFTRHKLARTATQPDAIRHPTPVGAKENAET